MAETQIAEQEKSKAESRIPPDPVGAN